MSQKIIIANWKTNPTSLKEALSLAQKTEEGAGAYKNVRVVIAPPFPFLYSLKQVLKNVKLGAQDAFFEEGPHTGEVSWKQLKNLGVSYVIIGHSERKLQLGESDDLINKKVLAVLSGGVSVILCVGEKERLENEIPEIVGEQLKKALDGVKKKFIKNLTIAYEPVWAISTGPAAKPESPEELFKTTVYIKKIIFQLFGNEGIKNIKVIYGGSVNSRNINSFLKDAKMDGVLVGGASLNATEFMELVKNANRT